MARLSIEDEAWTGFGALADLVGWDEFKVIGKMVAFWKRTQDLEFKEVGRKQIGLFLKISDDEELSRFIESACEVGFLMRISRTKFAIRGNDKHIDKLKEYRNKAKIGGRSRAAEAARSENGKFQPAENTTIDSSQSDQPSAGVNSSASLCSSMLSSSMHSNAKHFNNNNSTDEDRRLAERWHAHAIRVQPWLKHSVEKFAEGIAKLRRVVGLSPQEAIALFDFIEKDDFWSDKAISPTALLKRSSRNDMRKIDNILSKMKRGWDKMQGVKEFVNGTGDFDPFMGVE